MCSSTLELLSTVVFDFCWITDFTVNLFYQSSLLSVPNPYSSILPCDEEEAFWNLVSIIDHWEHLCDLFRPFAFHLDTVNGSFWEAYVQCFETGSSSNDERLDVRDASASSSPLKLLYPRRTGALWICKGWNQELLWQVTLLWRNTVFKFHVAG